MEGFLPAEPPAWLDRDLGQPGRAAARLFPEPLAAKVPEITFLFWVVKILTTCGGEAVSDYLALGNRQVGAVVDAGLFVIALCCPSRTPPHLAAPYFSLPVPIPLLPPPLTH